MATIMKQNQKDWGIDSDPEDQPAYPMRQDAPDDPHGMEWQRPTRQRATVRVLHSNERPDLTAVFGTAVPPRGLSGLMRRFAFRYSESSWYHWLTLMLADRVDVVEGIVSDLLHLRIPNIPGEMGMRADWKYNKKGFFIKTGVMLAIVGGIVYWAKRK